jgi:hypothetical protein
MRLREEAVVSGSPPEVGRAYDLFVRKPSAAIPKEAPDSLYWLMKRQGEQVIRKTIGYGDLPSEVEPDLIAIITDESIKRFDRTTAIAVMAQLPGPTTSGVLRWAVEQGGTRDYLCACICALQKREGVRAAEVFESLQHSRSRTVKQYARIVLAELGLADRITPTKRKRQ